MINALQKEIVADTKKERIMRYWGKRSEGFLEQRRMELHHPMAKRWVEEIKKVIPKDAKKILDIGCGTGFFSILLAKEGYDVIGTDLTPEMVAYARILSSEEAVDCTYEIMDAEKLSFKDETFDVVISRNLTWTLVDVEKAYGEWKRVLKKGGVLINFDANYGKADFTDYSDLSENHAHHQLGNETMIECESIKRELPVSFVERPAWDMKTLDQLHMKDLYMDLGISQRIYLEKDDFYNPTPLFLIKATKGESDD